MKRIAAALLLAPAAVACDPPGRPIEHPGLERLKPGISGELDARGVFGVPGVIVEAGDGSRGFQYSLGPERPAHCLRRHRHRWPPGPRAERARAGNLLVGGAESVASGRAPPSRPPGRPR